MVATPNSSVAPREYLAFISYRHADNKQQGRQWASWLHQALETYEVPADLVGKTNSRGEVIPERIYPIFRDEEELPAHADLANSITGALANSRLLVVLCSPNAVASSYVADEIRFFKQLGHSDRIIAAMIDGEPNASWDQAKQAAGVPGEAECFPLPLQFVVDEQGQLTDKRAEPIAADFRVNLDGKTEQGWTNVEALRQHLKTNTALTELQIKAAVANYQQQQQLMLLKIIAGILGVPLGELTKRDQAYQLELQRKNAKRLRQWLSGVAALAIVATGAGFYAWQQRAEAIVQRDKAEALLANVRENLRFMNFELRDVLTAYVPSDKRVEVMHHIDALASVLEQYSTTANNLEDQRKIATALLQKADVILQNAEQDSGVAIKLIEKAQAIYEKLVALDPTNSDYLRDLSIAYERLGDCHVRSRLIDRDATLRAYQASMAIREKLVALHPNYFTYLSDLSISHSKLGDSYAQLGDGEGALKSYQAGLIIVERLVALDSENTEILLHLSGFYGRLGDRYAQQGDVVTALTTYQAYVATAQKLVAFDPANIDFLNNLSTSYNRLGYSYARQGNGAGALKAYQEGMAINEKLVALDPTNIEFLSDLSMSYNNLGNSYVQQGDISGALKAYQAGIAIAEKLVALSPENNQFQEDLLRSYSNIAQTYDTKKEFVLAEKSMMTGIVTVGIDVQSQPLTEPKLQLLKMRSGSYLSWSWYALFTKQINQIPTTLEKVIEYLPENKDETVVLHTNLAHAYLLTGNYKSAKAIYEKFKGYKFQDGTTWDKAIIADFVALKKDGLTHPDFARVANEVFGVSFNGL